MSLDRPSRQWMFGLNQLKTREFQPFMKKLSFQRAVLDKPALDWALLPDYGYQLLCSSRLNFRPVDFADPFPTFSYASTRTGKSPHFKIVICHNAV